MSFLFTETVTIEVPQIQRQLSVFSESEDHRTKHGLVVEIAAIHTGLTQNFTYYTTEALESSINSWVNPYPRPIIMNHDQYSEPVGRVMAARMDQEEDGTPFVRLQAAITDSSAIEKVMDRRYLTGSVGGKADSAICSVCEADWANASMMSAPCKHSRGKTYKGKLAWLEMGGIDWVEYSWVNKPADQRSGTRAVGVSETKEGAEEDEWVRPARVFSINMNEEEILELTDSDKEPLNILEATAAKQVTPVYMQLKGSFISALAADMMLQEQQVEEAGVKKDGPYGKVKYADPGYQDDDKPRYPLDTKDHIRAAWSYINQKKNAAKYTPEQVKKIKARIKAAAKKAGIDISNEEFDVTTDTITEEEDILAVSESLSSDLADLSATEEEQEEVAESEEAEDVTEDEDIEESEEEVTEGEESPEGQEDSNEEDVDKETSSGAPISRESEDEADEVEEPETEEVVDEEESEEAEESSEDTELGELDSEQDIANEVETLKSRVEELESREQALVDENAKLKSLLKQSLAERVVDAKISLGLAEDDERAQQLEEHVKRSASSLADSLRDLASMPRGFAPSVDSFPTVTEESGAVEDEGTFTEGDEVIEDEVDPETKLEDALVDVLMARRKF